MSVEKIYSEDGLEINPSRATLFLQGLVTFLWWVALVILVVFLLVLACSVLAMAGVSPLKAQLFNDIEPLPVFVSSLSVIIGVGVFLIILKQLRSICQTLVVGDPFVPENARRLRIIWIAVAVGEVSRLLSGVLLSFAMGTTSLADKNMVLPLDFSPAVWFLVFAFIIFAEVFREGARLRQEQKLTV